MTLNVGHPLQSRRSASSPLYEFEFLAARAHATKYASMAIVIALLRHFEPAVGGLFGRFLTLCARITGKSTFCLTAKKQRHRSFPDGRNELGHANRVR